jgi:cytidylate kinase
MPVITLFGGTFGDDEQIARGVARALEYPFAGREILLAASQRCEVPEAKLSDVLEKEPHWWARWQENLRPYQIALQAAMTEAALAENIVYHGHVGHGLLPGIRHVLRVLLTAPMDYRIAQVRERQGLDAKAARHYIEHVEKARARRLMALFGADWRDPGQYALILNLAQMSAASAQQTIAQAAKLSEYQATAESRQHLADLALTAKIQAYLLTYPGLRKANIQVDARQGAVRLSGIVSPAVLEEDVRSAVAMMPGVQEVTVNFVSISSTELSYG